jgi:hypothetical protein
VCLPRNVPSRFLATVMFAKVITTPLIRRPSCDTA